MKSIAFFAARGPKPGTADRVLMVDYHPMPRGATLRQETDRVAREQRMRASDAPARWGGRNSAELIAVNPTYAIPVAAHRMLVTERDGYLYRLTYMATPEHAADLAAYEAMAAGTNWLPLEHAGRGVAARTPAVSLPTGIVFSIPDPFRPDMASKATHVSSFLAFDLPLGRAVARLMMIPFAEPDAAHTMEKLKAEVTEDLGPQWELKEPLRWADEPGGGGAGPIAISASPRGASGDRWVEVLIARVGDGRATVFVLQYDRGDAAAGMARALPLLKDSIRPAATGR